MSFRIKTGDVSQPEDTLNAPSLTKQKTSTAANKIEIVSGAIVAFNTSTPLINPDAVLSQDRTAPSGQSNFEKKSVKIYCVLIFSWKIIEYPSGW